jgi:hypothetical protein
MRLMIGYREIMQGSDEGVKICLFVPFRLLSTEPNRILDRNILV